MENDATVARKWSVTAQRFPYALQGEGIDGVLGISVVSPDYMSFPGVSRSESGEK